MQNTNYDETEFGYDKMGRQGRVQAPTGTIRRTLFDSRGRESSTWIGLDNTPTAGEWTPTNTAGTDLVKVQENIYDGGDAGDGNLTETKEIPAGGPEDRRTQLHVLDLGLLVDLPGHHLAIDFNGAARRGLARLGAVERENDKAQKAGRLPTAPKTRRGDRLSVRSPRARSSR